MNAPAAGQSHLPPDVCVRALQARDARFDGVFFVAITSTRIYCRPICPARVSHPEHRRFYGTAAAAERAGFRPCMRCRPELAPGRAIVDGVSRLAGAAAQRIAAGALNDGSVAELARELAVSERHLRRALERELGVSPVQLAQTYRLLLAKRLLADTALPVTRVAYASGFRSLRRFHAVFRAQYGVSPGRMRSARERTVPAGDAPLPLMLGYRPPFDWDALLDALRGESLPGVATVAAGRYMRAVRVRGCTGWIAAEHAPRRSCVRVDVAPSLLPALMPLMARLRSLFDLDAEPTVIDACLRAGGLHRMVTLRPGVRVSGVFGSFEAVLQVLLSRCREDTVHAVVRALGEPVDGSGNARRYTAPTAASVAGAGVTGLLELGVPRAGARVLAGLASRMASGSLKLEPGDDADAARAALLSVPGVGPVLADAIAARATAWPDALPAHDAVLQRAAGTDSAAALRAAAEAWRPWRAYAAAQLRAARP